MDYMTYMALRGNRGGGDDGGERYGQEGRYEPYDRGGRYAQEGRYPSRGGPHGPHMPPYEEAGPWVPPYSEEAEMEGNIVPMDAYRQIGFESRRNQPRREDGRFKRRGMEGGQGAYGHYGGEEEQAVQFGGTFRMQDPGGHGGGKLTRGMAEQWVESMEGESDQHAKGGMFTWEQAQELGKKVGIQGGQRAIDFYAAINAVCSDYGHVLDEYKMGTPEIYAKLAKAWIEDPDAVKNKAAMYYRYIVEK